MNEKNNISEEFDDLRNIAPNFSRIKKQNPFEVPQNYFDKLPSILHEKCVEAEELKEIAPVLTGIKKENIFSVPNDYFEHLPYTIGERINAEKHQTSWIEKLAWIIRPKFAIPVSMAIIVAVIGLTLNINTENTKDVEYASNESSISYEEIDKSHYLNDIDEAMLIEEIEVEHISNSNKENEVIENYLMDNHTDVSQLINQL